MARVIRANNSMIQDDQGRCFETTFEALTHFDPVFHQLPSGYTVVGYATIDTDVENPFDRCQGFGHIYVKSDTPSDEFMKEFLHPLAVSLFKYHGDWVVPSDGTYAGFDETRNRDADGVWVPDDSCRDMILSNAIRSFIPEYRINDGPAGPTVEYKTHRDPDGKAYTRPCKPGEKSYFFDNVTGEPTNTVLDERYNNVITLTIPHLSIVRTGFKSFVEAWREAAKLCNIPKINRKDMQFATRQQARIEAAGAAKLYSNWCNGNCFMAVAEVYDDNRRVHHAVDGIYYGGLIGDELVQAEIAQAVADLVEQVGRTMIANVPPTILQAAKKKQRRILRDIATKE